ncbi:hypothetical protein [Micromonospora humida]|uniref:hypothetical protein n=1 Tax=Micromonospora humida TaxID=2809018 RepID=UPI003429B435
MTTPAVCATADCGSPAVAVVTTAQNRVTVRKIRLDDPAAITAWADWLRCWPCTTAAVDQHVTTPAARPATEETRPR